MSGAIDISWTALAVYLGILVVPALIFHILRVPLLKPMLVGTARMGVQLILVGVYLEYLFRLNSLALNIAWLVIMALAACLEITRRAGLRVKIMLPVIFPGLMLTCVLILASFRLALDWRELFNPAYLIPMAGMILGNILRSNILVLNRFYADFRQMEHRYVHFLGLGATPLEAVKPFAATAYEAALAPTLANVATMGLVALPGMMTGQILGGSSPMVAIKYQILIVLAIFVAASLSTFLCLFFSLWPALDSMGRLRSSVFSPSRRG